MFVLALCVLVLRCREIARLGSPVAYCRSVRRLVGTASFALGRVLCVLIRFIFVGTVVGVEKRKSGVVKGSNRRLCPTERLAQGLFVGGRRRAGTKAVDG